MNDLAVARADASADAGCGLQHHHLATLQRQGARNRQSDHTGTDHNTVNLIHHATSFKKSRQTTSDKLCQKTL
jgi:hypothetical protein